MPELARFDGIILRMYAEAGGAHHIPHFHAYYGEAQAVYALPSLKRLAGTMPSTQQRRIVEWANAHAVELQAAWNDLHAGRATKRIE